LLNSYRIFKRNITKNIQFYPFFSDFKAPGSGVNFNADPCGSGSETLVTIWRVFAADQCGGTAAPPLPAAGGRTLLPRPAHAPLTNMIHIRPSQVWLGLATLSNDKVKGKMRLSGVKSLLFLWYTV